MIIKSVDLENIRSYKKQTINFDHGINFLSGDIGSGKSTILHATEFALLGFKRGDLEGYHLLRKGELEGSVKLTLQDLESNIEIEIFRKIKKSKSSDAISQENGYIKIENDLIELSPQELNSRIFDLLNFPKEFLTKDKNLIYRFTIYTAQEQLKEILFSQSDQKLEIIRKIFGIDNYKKLQDAITLYLQNSRSDKRVLESKLENKDKTKDEINQINSEIKKLMDNEKDLIEKQNPLKDKLEKCKQALQKREEFLEKLNEKKLKCEKVLSQIEQIKNELQDQKQKRSQLQTELNQLVHDNSKDSARQINDQIAEKQNKLNQIKKQEQEVDKSGIEDLSKEKEEIQKQILELDSKKKLKQTLSKDFDYILTKCRRKDTEVRIRNLEKEITKYEKLQSKLESKEKEVLRIELGLTNLENNLEEAKIQNAEMAHRKNCPTCKQELSQTHKKNLEEDLKKQALENQKQIKKLKLDQIKETKILHSIKNDKSNFEENKKQLTEETEKLRHLLGQEKKEKVQYEELSTLKKEIEELEVKKLFDALKHVEKLLDAKTKKEDLFQKQILEQRKLTEEISELKLQLEKQQNQSRNKKSLEENLNQLKEKISQFELKAKKEEEYKKILSNLNEKEIEIKQSKTNYSKLIDELSVKEREYSNQLSELKATLQEKTKYLTEKKESLDKIIQYEKELKRNIHNETFLSSTVLKIAQTIEKITFTKYYAEFNEEFEKLFKDLIEDNEIDVRLDELFSIIIEQNGYDIDIKNLSGGEKSSLAIAYRLGLKKIIENNLKTQQKLNLLILDEPTDGFSNEQIDRLGILLKETSLDQIILVSHDQKIESIADTIINIEKTNHISVIS